MAAMTAAARTIQPSGPSWPTPTALAAIGFVRCHADGCLIVFDPVNQPGRYCQRHQRQERDRRRHPPRRPASA
jgi:hypothetical protein